MLLNSASIGVIVFKLTRLSLTLSFSSIFAETVIAGTNCDIGFIDKKKKKTSSFPFNLYYFVHLPLKNLNLLFDKCEINDSR